MTPQDQQTYQRGATAALIGLVVQFALAVVMALIALWAASGNQGADTDALHPIAYHLFGGLPIWVVLWLIYVQHKQERAEALEAEQLARSDNRAAIFEEHAQDLQLARRRLDNLYRWGLGTVSVLVSIYLMVLGGLWLYWNNQRPQPLLDQNKALPLLAMCVAITFVAFIVARWVAGMTKVPTWQLLRGGASYLMGGALLSGLAALAATADWLNVQWAFTAFGVIAPLIMILVGAETNVTFALGAYRPRRPGEIPRPAFDSRALGLLTSPESIAKAVSDTINYQFGIEVSRSWFYRLLARAITPLILVGILILMGLSSIVIVEPHEQAVITRFGQLERIEDPGIHYKWPWPISRARKYPVARVQEISAGSVRGFIDRTKAILWTTQHTTEKEEYLLTAASPVQLDGQQAGTSVEQERLAGMGLVAANVQVQFWVKDLETYITNVPEPQRLIQAMKQRQHWEQLTQVWEAGGRQGPDPLADAKIAPSIIDPCPLLTAMASRRVSAYFMGKDIDSVLASGSAAGEELRSQIQQDVDTQKLGLEIVFVSMAGIHPPSENEVAAAFHAQVGALQDKKRSLEEAERNRIQMLTKVAGSYDRALALQKEIAQHRQLGAGATEQAVQAQAEKIYLMLRDSRGEARAVLYEAETYRWHKEITQRAQRTQFEAMLPAYRQAPDYFRARLYLDMLAKSLKDARKFLVKTKPDNPELWIDLKTQETDYTSVLGKD